MNALSADIRSLPGIGDRRAAALARLNIRTLGELLHHFPYRYEDRTVEKPIAALSDGESACIRALVATEPHLVRIRRGMELVKLRIVDESGSADVTFFNQNYRRDQLHRGESYVFYGKMECNGARRSMVNPSFEAEGSAGTVTGCILPLYHLTRGITNRLISDSVKAALISCETQLPELLPEEVRTQYGLVPVGEAYRSVHFPPDLEALRAARDRLIFEELFTLECALSLLRQKRVRADGTVIPLPEVGEFYASLPFSPTNAQRRAVDDALRDMSGGKCMSRLVQGDVGSGKTLVAAVCLWAAWRGGVQCAFMAPTEILAQQHFATLTRLLSPFGIRLALLTGSLRAAEKRSLKSALAAGEIDVLVGTHALLSDDVVFRKLGLVITDEQHRFGVEQRSALNEKGVRPHVLVMSATPIPRTLALMIYGDLDVSVIDELPPGRQRIDTVSVPQSYRERLNAFIRQQVAEGRQVFVVCPKVEEDEEIPDTPKLKSATEHAEALRQEFPELTVGCVHGRMKPKEKEAVMAAFVQGETDILVSTTVIEVGVDVPNASLMIVENADRFGLSQLHQLRGRVGRGVHKSWCVLVASENIGEDARERLRVLVRLSDGFAVAEEDLRLRGPGDFFGSRQHGLPEMHIADLFGRMDTVEEARSAAQSLLRADPELASHPALREHITRLFELKESTWN